MKHFSSENITAAEEIKILIKLSMHYNNICDCYPSENPGMHTFFRMRDERIKELLGSNSHVFFDLLIGNDEPQKALEFAVNNLRFEKESAESYQYNRK